MRNLKRIYIEVDRVRIICQSTQQYATWCAGCGEDVDLLSVSEAAKLTGISFDAIVTQIAKGKIHLGIRPEALLVCLNSLLSSNKIRASVKAH